MKKTLISFVFFFGILTIARAQQMDADIGWSNACYYMDGMQGDSLCENERSYLVDPNIEANEVLLKVLSVVGLRPSFTLQPCSGIKNCVATIGSDHMRYIIYDKEFIHQLADTTRTNWVFLSIFAHEVLHHLNGHTFSARKSNETRRLEELEADKWSGKICASLGATLEQAQYTMMVIPHPADETTSTHPSKEKRLAAIEEGFNEAIYRKPQPKEKFTSVDDITMHRNGFKAVHSLDSLKTFINNGEIIQRVQFLDDKWYVFYTIDSSKPFRDFAFSDKPPFYDIYEMKNKNKQVKSIDFQNNKWIVMFEEDTAKKNQFVKIFSAFNNLVADSLFKAGYMIEDLCYGQGQWLAVLDSAAAGNCIDQLVWFDDNYPFEEIKLKTREPDFYDVSTARFLNNKWVSILQKNKNPKHTTSYFQSRYTTFRIEQMIEGDINNYRITQAGFDGRNWVFVMKKTRDEKPVMNDYGVNN